MTDYRRYFCSIRVDSTFNAGNLPMQNIQKLNEKIENAMEEWATEMINKGLKANIRWSWSENINV